ncbi:major facilitator superfamily domain-containing protein [Lanmaoa asiatica]|nr:major facilitator superfamily domain-containing protein [Lanmaoa asiatica]
MSSSPSVEKAGSVVEIEAKVPDDNVVPGRTFDIARRAIIERRLKRKLDLRLGILVIIYILNYELHALVGVVNSFRSSARLQGFQQDLHLDSTEYSTVLSILSVGYIIMQVPSNMFLNWIGRPSIYLPCCMVLWGTISALTGVTTNYVGALLCRFFIGFVEAAYFPGALYVISRWYKRDEVGLRTSIFYCGSLISNGWGALIASGILARMQGVLGHAAWRWLFYIEGAITVFVAVCSIFILPDFPQNTRWLTPEERELAILRLQEDLVEESVDDVDGLSVTPLKGLYMALADWKMWWFTLAAISQLVTQSFFLFFPTLSATMGFDTTVSLVLCAPPWCFTAILAFAVYTNGTLRHSDLKKKRFIYIAASECIGLLGFIIAICTMNTVARYISLFLMVQTYLGLICFYTWMSNSIPRPPAKRAVSLAFINGFSQLGNVAGSYAFPAAWGPSYRKSFGICIATGVTHILLCYVMHRHLVSENKKFERAEEEAARTGRKSSSFRYIV